MDDTRISQLETRFNDQIDKLENKFQAHADKIEAKFDQLTTFMTSLATLKERDTHQTDNIVNLRELITDTQKTIATGIGRVHTRLDDSEKNHAAFILANVQTTSSIGLKSEERLQIEKLAILNEVYLKIKLVEEDIRKIDKNTDDTMIELEKWKNRGIGTILATSVFIGIIQIGGLYILNSVKTDYQNQLSDNKKDIQSIKVQIQPLLKDK